MGRPILIIQLFSFFYVSGSNLARLLETCPPFVVPDTWPRIDLEFRVRGDGPTVQYPSLQSELEKTGADLFYVYYTCSGDKQQQHMMVLCRSFAWESSRWRAEHQPCQRRPPACAVPLHLMVSKAKIATCALELDVARIGRGEDTPCFSSSLKARDAIYATGSHDQQMMVNPEVTVKEFSCHSSTSFLVYGASSSPEGFKCGFDSQWFPEHLPKCQLLEYCDVPQAPEHGSIALSGLQLDLTAVMRGSPLTFKCDSGYRPEGTVDLTCLVANRWSSEPPKCVQKGYLGVSKRLVVIIGAGGLLGLLLIVIIVFLIQRHILIRKARTIRRQRLVEHTSVSPQVASNYIAQMTAGRHGSWRQVRGSVRRAAAQASGNGGVPFSISRANSRAELVAGLNNYIDVDRLALIAYAEACNTPLPSYDEAINSPIGVGNSLAVGVDDETVVSGVGPAGPQGPRRGMPAFDTLSTISGYANRALRRLPSLSSLRSRDSAVRPSSQPTTGGGSISQAVVNANQTSLRIDSSEAVGNNTSDDSTVVTVETMSSGFTTSSNETRLSAGTDSLRCNSGSISGSDLNADTEHYNILSGDGEGPSHGRGGLTGAASSECHLTGEEAPLLASVILTAGEEDDVNVVEINEYTSQDI